MSGTQKTLYSYKTSRGFKQSYCRIYWDQSELKWKMRARGPLGRGEKRFHLDIVIPASNFVKKLNAALYYGSANK